jgi:uncharacterized phage protein (TIGR01671 family)
MNEIKFRGKRIDNGGWVYGCYIKGVGDKIGKHYILPDRMNVPCVDGNEVIPETVGQFTGLHDPEGVEIYEGDVVRRSSKQLDQSFDNEICYDGASFKIKVTDISTHETSLQHLDIYIPKGLYGYEIEVIGTIHDEVKK